jgi:hypothetical protein
MGEHRPGVESSHQHRSCPPRQTGRLQAKRSRRIPSSDRHAFILLTPTFAGVGHALAQMGTTRAAIFSVRIRADASPRGTAIEGVGREGCGERRSPSQGVAAAAGRGRPRNGALLEPALPSPWPVRSRAAGQHRDLSQPPVGSDLLRVVRHCPGSASASLPDSAAHRQ